MEKKRTYRMAGRARSLEETRQRIVEAAMSLHEEIGPRATTVSAIAERAGVQRLTVYRHFPDETAILQACTSHWASLNPLPDPAGWRSIDDRWERVRAAISAFNAYHTAAQGMLAASHRDVASVAALQGPMAELQARVDKMARDLAMDLANAMKPRPRNTALLEAAVGHALAFTTWADLQQRGLSDADKTELVFRWLKGTGSPAAG